jgi:2-methylcitrate dehydratase PrpD
LTLTAQLAKRCAALEFADLPGEVVATAQLCVLDWLGVTLAGSHEPGPEMLLSLARPVSDGGASVIGHPGVHLTVEDAALINGTSSHVLDFDDVNTLLIGHPSVAILAAAMAVAEALNLSGQHLLTAFVAGYETACRVAAAVGPTSYLRGFHNTGTIGTFGAAAASAHLMGLDAEHTEVALGLAATQAAGLGCMVGTMTKSLHAGKACQSGVFAARLAQRGFTANRAAVEAPKGFAATATGHCDEAAGLADPPRGWHLLNNLFKFDASCYMTHSALAGTRDLMAENNLTADDIAAVRVHLGDLELATCAVPRPQTGLEVKFSVAHLVAMAALRRPTTVIRDADAQDRDVVALRSKVTVAGDGNSGAPTRIDISTGDGRQLSTAVDVNTADPDFDRTRDRVHAKFIAVAATTLGNKREGNQRAEALVAATTSLARHADVEQFLALCVPA